MQAPAPPARPALLVVSIRRIAQAVFAGILLAFGCDLLLQLALGAVRATGHQSVLGLVTARVIDRGAWLVVPLVTWLAAPTLASVLEGELVGFPEYVIAQATALRTAGVALIALPLLWLVASTAVRIVGITLLGDWRVDGQVFLAPGFYSDLILSNAPWMLAGAAVIAWGRHRGR